jgi:chemotaxis protein methyltransferase CheR
MGKTDAECVAFLQWALPRLGLRWSGYRKVHAQVCKRVARRCRQLGLADIASYRDYLAQHAGEWPVLDGLCAITISRFYRDRAVFDSLAQNVLPALARSAQRREAATLAAWSIGCASGEEPYSIALAWHFVSGAAVPGMRLKILATDVDATVLERARAGCYSAGSLKGLPAAWRTQAFEARDAEFCLRDDFREGIEFRHEDMRKRLPDETFDLVLCRNLAFTYFDEAAQRAALDGISRHLRPGGALVLGTHEAPPPDRCYTPWPGLRPLGIFVFRPDLAETDRFD